MWSEAISISIGCSQASKSKMLAGAAIPLTRLWSNQESALQELPGVEDSTAGSDRHSPLAGEAMPLEVPVTDARTGKSRRKVPAVGKYNGQGLGFIFC